MVAQGRATQACWQRGRCHANAPATHVTQTLCSALTELSARHYVPTRLQEAHPTLCCRTRRRNASHTLLQDATTAHSVAGCNPAQGAAIGMLRQRACPKLAQQAPMSVADVTLNPKPLLPRLRLSHQLPRWTCLILGLCCNSAASPQQARLSVIL
eukprot:358975-Chlamydomonas_euryale.AAC.4